MAPDDIIVQMPFFISYSILHFLCLSSAALFVFLTASAWARIIWIYFFSFPCLRCSLQGIVFVCSGYFGNLLTFNLLFYFYMEQQADGFFLPWLRLLYAMSCWHYDQSVCPHVPHAAPRTECRLADSADAGRNEKN